jgi:hypothetical protein
MEEKKQDGNQVIKYSSNSLDIGANGLYKITGINKKLIKRASKSII